MSAAFASLLGFAAWTLLLVTVVLLYRTSLVLARKRPANAWPRGAQTDDPAIVTRIAHAHANCLESLPVFAVLVLSASALGRTAALDPLAPWVLYARLAQSAVHLTGTSAWQVFIRASFYTVQVALFFWMFALLLR